VVLHDDVATAAEPLRHYTALYVGGMGSREKNFYNALAVRMGFGEAAAEVQDLYLARQHRDAAAAVPLDLIDQTALIGPRARVRERLVRYAEAGVTTLSIAPYAATLEQRLHVVRTMAELLDETGLAD
jgi:alkanesulfonate monooxygenase SsuD/methylene tetrahydromethanopterin reductase-like flavin-dependent oxidoreductase (luciferase family)